MKIVALEQDAWPTEVVERLAAGFNLGNSPNHGSFYTKLDRGGPEICVG